MNYTENYHLPQWKETDRVRMTDFNQMCADMEAGLNANAQAAASAKTRANEGVSDAAAAQSAADAAQTAADNAQTTADAALAKANAAYAPGQKPYAVGSYVGTGTKHNITIGFKPSFIIISGQEDGTTDLDVLLATPGVNRSSIHFYSDYATLYIAADAVPRINVKDRTYNFIAFR